MLPRFSVFFLKFQKLWQNLWRKSVTKRNCDGNPSQNSVAIGHCDGDLWPKSTRICDGLGGFRHKLWRTPSQFFLVRHNFPKDITFFYSYLGNCDGHFHHNSKQSVTISVTKLLWRTVFCHKFPSQIIVTKCCPSQIVTGPSQLKLWPMKSWRTVFRHNFRHNWHFSVTILGIFRHKFRHKLPLFP